MEGSGLPLLFRALQFSAAKHRDDTRKDPRRSPYINHPISVASELVEAGVTDPELLAASLLHDTLEDTWTTPEDLEREFGVRVRRLVEAVTDDTTLPAPEKKRLQVQKAPHLPPEAKQIKIADKICNLLDVMHAPAAGWRRSRRREYVDFSAAVVEGCRGVNPALDDRFERVLRDARESLSSAIDTPQGLRVIAVDWSGARKGARHRIWLAEVQDGTLLRLEEGRSREEIVEHLIEEAKRDPALVVGLDFAFSFPAWFLKHHGAGDVRALWALVEREGEDWLARCPVPFWGRPGRSRPGEDVLPEQWRQTEREVPTTGSSRPKSVFQIGGAGAVGTGSIRGMPALKRLVEAGFSVWPFDPATPPAIVEIYPRVLTGEVVKSDPAVRDAYLLERYPNLSEVLRVTAASSDDAFDAAVSALVMWECVEALVALPRSENRTVRREGRIWFPGSQPN